MNLRIVRLAYWLIRLRWFAIVGIFIAYYIAKYYLHINISDLPVYSIIVFLILLNVLSFSFLKYLQKSQVRKSLKNVKRIINFQISTDFIVLTILLHYSGGVENPFIIYYIFHMIIGSIMLTTKESFLQTSFALMLLGSMTFLEYIGIIQHFPLRGFIITNMYNNLTYLACTGFIFISTSYFVVYITRTIIKQSEKHEAAYLQANAMLKQKDKVKNEYVMRITHDIKGHITAIQSCISVLNGNFTGPLTPQQEEFVSRALKRIQILCCLVKASMLEFLEVSLTLFECDFLIHVHKENTDATISPHMHAAVVAKNVRALKQQSLHNITGNGNPIKVCLIERFTSWHINQT